MSRTKGKGKHRSGKAKRKPGGFNPNQETYAKRDATILAMGFASYQDYLASDLWLKIRTRVLAAHNGRCALCPREATNVHHRGYGRDTLAGTNDGALAPLCGACHRFVEFDPQGRKRTLQDVQRTYDARASRRAVRAEWLVRRRTPKVGCLGCGKRPKRQSRYCRHCAKLGPAELAAVRLQAGLPSIMSVKPAVPTAAPESLPVPSQPATPAPCPGAGGLFGDD